MTLFPWNAPSCIASRYEPLNLLLPDLTMKLSVAPGLCASAPFAAVANGRAAGFDGLDEIADDALMPPSVRDGR